MKWRRSEIVFDASNKRQHGQYFTQENPFMLKPFRQWMKKANLENETILEPFAGNNDLVTMLCNMDLCHDFKAYDIKPTNQHVRKRDTLKKFPLGYEVCVTNPPWLASYSAHRRKMNFPNIPYDDLYKYSLELCLKNCSYVCAILPETFIHSGLFQERLSTFVSLPISMFADTDHPTCLALFTPEKTKDVNVYVCNKHLGTLSTLYDFRPPVSGDKIIKFNHPNGNVGLLGADNTGGDSIRFCDPSELEGYNIRQACRYITKIKVPNNPDIDAYNKLLKKFRKNTYDILMAPIRGRRKDGKYRRRLDFRLARDMIMHA